MALCHLEFSIAELCWHFCTRKVGLGILSEHNLRRCTSNFTQWPQVNSDCGIWFKCSPSGFFAYSADCFLIWTFVVTHTGRGRKTKGLLHLLADCSCTSLGLGHGRPEEASGAALRPSLRYRATNSTCCNWMPGSFRHCLSSEAFSETFSEQRTKKSETERFLCLAVFPGAIQQVPVGKTHKEKLCGWLLLLVCIFIFLIQRTSHIYPIPWTPQQEKKINIKAEEIVFCKTNSDI